ncbi:hypothetical protein R5W23_000130 [Gemmata sp. JC673]|uniref:DUF3108 domain-containing protein n=1 Tax=Gemmata algarum TaxID=2975278 RepID=A0ABU5ERJ3_9BACT|nr:hypothetical protein [Gemmata algarum]MDY3557603.1 hypothetical protein [Gemmata algarum]
MRWTPLVVLCLALSVASAAPVPKHLMPKDEGFWPTAVGTKWEYEQPEFAFTEEITKADPIKSGVRLTVRVRSKGEWDATYEVGPGGVFARTDGPFVIEKQMIRLPVKVGDSWAFAYPIQKGLKCDGGTVTVSGSEEVKVPAGTFMATKVVSTVTEVGGQPIPKPTTYTDWYAKGVGLIRRDWDGGGRVLKSFTPGTK